jgi:deoxyribonuclease V
MILAIDVHYKVTYAKAVGVLFDWKDEEPKEIITTTINEVEEYQSGQFYKRELPCILQLLKQIDLEKVECIVVDGHIYINNDKTLGLGGHLYKSLKKKCQL